MRHLLAFFLLVAATTSHASSSAVCQTASQQSRPCVGLVLAGGGARGFAHIGVLKAVEELEIPIDLVVGTSMGSFVGGLFAAGYSAAEIESRFRSTHWSSGYRDDLPRSQIPNRRKRHNDSNPIQFGLGFDSDGFQLPKGLIQGQGMKRLIDRNLGIQASLNSFDDLNIPYRAIAADLETGEQVIISDGDLAVAMQASMSLPGILRPIELNGRVLVDGGITNNLPISVAKDAGADIVIAVDIGTPPMSRDDIGSSFDVLNQLSNFLTQANQAVARGTLDENDIHIRPKLEEVSLINFDQLDAGIAVGYGAASIAFADYEKLPKSSSDAKHSSVRSEQIQNIRLINKTRLSDAFLLHRMQVNKAGPYSQEQIRQGIERLYGQGTIARVTSSLKESPLGRTVELIIEEKEWGPGYVDFNLSFEDNFRSFSLFQVGAAARLTNLSPYGAEWKSAFEFGTEKFLQTELYWPLWTSDFFLHASGEYERDIYNISSPNINNGAPLGEAITTLLGVKSGIGYEFSDSLDVLAAIGSEEGDIKLPELAEQTFGTDQIDIENDRISVELSFDTLDEADFSRHGVRFMAVFERNFTEALDLNEYSNRTELNLSFAGSLGAHTLKPTLRYGDASDNEVLGFSNFELGGFLSLSGNNRDFVSGSHLRFARLVYTYEIAENQIGGIRLPLYLGLSYEAGNTWNTHSEISWSSAIQSGSAFLGWDSPLGPAFLAYGRSDNGSDSFYVSLGKPF